MLADGTYTAQTAQSDAAGNIGYSAATTFTVDTTPPTVTSITPSISGDTYSFSFTGSDNISAPNALTFEASLDGGARPRAATSPLPS